MVSSLKYIALNKDLRLGWDYGVKVTPMMKFKVLSMSNSLLTISNYVKISLEKGIRNRE